MEFAVTTLHPTRSIETNVSNPMIEEDLGDGGEGFAQESQPQHESIAVHKPRREIRRPSLYNDTMAYALPNFQLQMMMSFPLIKSQSSVLKRISGRQLWKRRCNLFKRMKLGGLFNYLRVRRQLGIYKERKIS